MSNTQQLSGAAAATAPLHATSAEIQAARSTPAGLAWLASNRRWQMARHLLLLDEALYDVATRRCMRLLVTMPPRHGKSTSVSHYFPAWYLGVKPEHRIILASYEADFAASWGRKARDVLTEWGPTLYGVGVRQDSSAANRWDIARHAGGMVTAGAGGAITGRGADVLIIDDPIKNAAEALSATYRDNLWAWFQSTAYTRLEPHGAIILTLTRWHEDDVAGRLLAQMKHGGDQWRVLSLPAIAEEASESEGIVADALGRAPGEPLWPEQYNLAQLAAIRRTLEADFWWYALYQQRPTPRSGAVFQRAWFSRRYRLDALPPFVMLVQSIDSAFKDGVGNDYSVIATWATDGRDYYLLRVWRAHVQYPQLIAAIKDEAAAARAQYGKLDAVLVEDKASGQSAIQTLQQESALPVIAVPAQMSKIARAESVSLLFEAGRVVLPESAPWLADWIDEHVRFPRGAHDDQVDTSSPALSYLRDRAVEGTTLRLRFFDDALPTPDERLAQALGIPKEGADGDTQAPAPIPQPASPDELLARMFAERR